MSVGSVGGQVRVVGVAGAGAEFEGLDLVGDLRRPLVWPARAASQSRTVELPDLTGPEPAGVVLLTGLVGVLARYTGQDEVALGLTSGGSAVRVGVA
ncbi:hypothetical protein AB0L34_33435, partial [Micromonospora sp. NPDC052213]|uniref:hypothetical protein n=1 Tax=Micromonospora sp. NPDC052213 TaxID=3155812 RepID=UPI003437B680